jgi:hypothetical protein
MCPEICPELDISHPTERHSCELTRPQRRQKICKSPSFNPKVVGSIPTGGIGTGWKRASLSVLRRLVLDARAIRPSSGHVFGVERRRGVMWYSEYRLPG